jgi:ribosomal protein S18 acetylase RimI-like enzyme
VTSTEVIGIEYRSGAPADTDALLEFWSRAAENESRPADSRAAVESLLERDPAALIVAERGGRIVGTIIAGFDGWRCHLYRLAVDPDERRQGIGRELLRRAEARLVALGATRIDAMVLDGNRLGQAIWETSGYRRQPDWSRWVRHPG